MHPREFLTESYAHLPPAQALAGLSAEDAVRRPTGAPHSIAAIVAHMTFWMRWWAQRCDGIAEPPAATAALGWPAVEEEAWPSIQAEFLAALDRLVAIGERDTSKPVAPPIEFPPAFAHLTIGDALAHAAIHNSHHLGQVILLRQLMAQWPPPSGAFTW